MQAGAIGASLATTQAAAVPDDTRDTLHKGAYKMPKNAKLLSIKHADGSESLGAVVEGGVIDLRATAKKPASTASCGNPRIPPTSSSIRSKWWLISASIGRWSRATSSSPEPRKA